MPINISHIVDALASLGGEAHLKDITKRVKEIAPEPIPKTADANIRARLQDYSSDSKSFEGRDDIFESVYGVNARRGIWRLRQSPITSTDDTKFIDGSEAFIEASEGRAKLRVHLSRERSRKLVKAFKDSLIDPRCEACNFSFNENYGELGRNYIEAHHRVPLSELAEGSKTKLSDLAALCANCHRVIHANGLMSVEQLSDHLKNTK